LKNKITTLACIETLHRRCSVQQGLRKHRDSVVFRGSELLDSPPIQNFDNEKSKVFYKNIWLG